MIERPRLRYTVALCEMARGQNMIGQLDGLTGGLSGMDSFRIIGPATIEYGGPAPVFVPMGASATDSLEVFCRNVRAFRPISEHLRSAYAAWFRGHEDALQRNPQRRLLWRKQLHDPKPSGRRYCIPFEDLRPRLLFFHCVPEGVGLRLGHAFEFGAVLTDPTGRNVIEEFEAMIFCPPARTAPKGHPDSVECEGPLLKLQSMAVDAVYVAHDAAPKLDALEEALFKLALRLPRATRGFDTKKSAGPLLRNPLRNLGLSTLLRHFHVEHPGSALGVARACRELFFLLTTKPDAPAATSNTPHLMLV